uniref:Uncharacterized protein n=1 Tax=Photinus pyralis TaxID=7054 RepID=A0A1Y1N265_PHOPY
MDSTKKTSGGTDEITPTPLGRQQVQETMMRSKLEKTSAVGYPVMMLLIYVLGFVAYIKEPWAFTGVTLLLDLRSNLLSSSVTCVYLAENEYDGLLHGTSGRAKKGYNMEVGLIALGVFFPLVSYPLMYGCYRKPGRTHSWDAHLSRAITLSKRLFCQCSFFAGV